MLYIKLFTLAEEGGDVFREALPVMTLLRGRFFIFFALQVPREIYVVPIISI